MGGKGKEKGVGRAGRERASRKCVNLGKQRGNLLDEREPWMDVRKGMWFDFGRREETY